MKKLITLIILIGGYDCVFAQTYKSISAKPLSLGIGSPPTGGVTLTANPASSPFTLQFPVDDGAPNQVLTTDGNGVLSWSSGGGLSGSGTANQLAYWSGASSLTGSTSLTYNGTTLAVTANTTANPTAALSNTNAGNGYALQLLAGNIGVSTGTVAMPIPNNSSITIPSNCTLAVITDNASNANDQNVTMPPGTNGKILFILNLDINQIAKLPPELGADIKAYGNGNGDKARMGMFIYYNSQWHRVDE